MIEAAKLHNSCISVLAIVANGAQTPIPTGTCDLVTLRHVLQHVPEPSAVVREAHRITRRGGQVFAQVPGPKYFSVVPFCGSHNEDAIGRFSTTELASLFSEAGFAAEIQSLAFAFLFPSVAALLDQMRAVAITDRTAGYRHREAAGIHSFLDAYHSLFERCPLGLIEGEYLLIRATK